MGSIGRDDPVTLAMLKLRPGDIVYAEKGRYAGRVAILSSAHRKGGMRFTGLTMPDIVMLDGAGLHRAAAGDRQDRATR